LAVIAKPSNSEASTSSAARFSFVNTVRWPRSALFRFEKTYMTDTPDKRSAMLGHLPEHQRHRILSGMR
jgi:hypothetical protein